MITKEELTQYLRRFLSNIVTLKDIDPRVEPLTPYNFRKEYLMGCDDIYATGTKTFNELVRKYQRFDRNSIPEEKLYEKEIRYAMDIDNNPFNTLMDFIGNPSGKNIYLLNKGKNNAHIIYNPSPFAYFIDLDVYGLNIGYFMLDDDDLVIPPFEEISNELNKAIKMKNWKMYFETITQDTGELMDEVMLLQYCKLKSYFKTVDEAFETYEIMKNSNNFYYTYNPNCNDKTRLMEKMYQIYKYLQKQEQK